MYGITIENGKKHKCSCNSIYAIENENEILYRNITLVYIDKNTKSLSVKCKQCKSMIENCFYL